MEMGEEIIFFFLRGIEKTAVLLQVSVQSQFWAAPNLTP